MKKKWRWIDIPEGTSGSFSVKHSFTKPGDTVPSSNMRQALLRGQPVTAIKFPQGHRWHKLLQGQRLWMTDLPIEQIQHDTMLRGFRGSVLVGGLGLGYAVSSLRRKRHVHRIVVVEKSKDVIDLVAPYTRGCEVVHADLFDYLKDCDETFDAGFYDIWTSDGEGTFHDTVIPLRKLSLGKVRHVVCWNEDTMRSQLLMGLLYRARILDLDASSRQRLNMDISIDSLCETTGCKYTDWAVPYWRAVKAGARLSPHEYARDYGR